jgi:hypothetical protein
MPHAFKASPDHPAVDYLVRLHADLGGKILANKKEAARLADAMKHVEAVIRLFDPDYNMRGISVRRRHQGNPWFKRGTLFRRALDVLRKASEPLTCREITERVLAANGITDASPKAVIRLMAAVQASLVDNEGKTVGRIGEGVPGRWVLIPQRIDATGE